MMTVSPGNNNDVSGGDNNDLNFCTDRFMQVGSVPELHEKNCSGNRAYTKTHHKN
jgi:hypothetical protein